MTDARADQPQEVRINWTVHEYMGSEVYRPNEVGTPLTDAIDLKVGDEVWVPAMASNGYYPMTITEDVGEGKLYAKGGSLLVCLTFAEDDRKAWVASGYINTRGLEKLGLMV